MANPAKPRFERLCLISEQIKLHKTTRNKALGAHKRILEILISGTDSAYLFRMMSFWQSWVKWLGARLSLFLAGCLFVSSGPLHRQPPRQPAATPPSQPAASQQSERAFWQAIERQFAMVPVRDANNKVVDYEVLGKLRISQGQSPAAHRATMVRLQRYFVDYYKDYQQQLEKFAPSAWEAERRNLILQRDKTLGSTRSLEQQILEIQRRQLNGRNEAYRQLSGYRIIVRTRPKQPNKVSRVLMERPKGQGASVMATSLTQASVSQQGR